MKHLLLLLTIAAFAFNAKSQQANEAGNLFIIGGGSRSPELIRELIHTAQLAPRDHIVVLPMSTTEPDTAFYYIRIQLEKACSNTIANLNFSKETVNNRQWLDSLEHARLIFITGGDQTRFMNVVLHTPVYDAIHRAYRNGSTIAGTSAGAAVMTRNMITGNEKRGDTAYNSTFRKLWMDNLEITEGLGLMDSAIVDQHFIARSRYNRLLSAIAQYPSFQCIGIDEGTAIVVHGSRATVVGESQVMVFSHPRGLKVTSDGLIKMEDIQLSIYTAGDHFSLRHPYSGRKRQ